MLIQNIWNDDVATIGYYDVPVTDINITFTVSGFNYDNPDATGEADTTAPAEDEAVSEAPAEDASEAPAVDTGADASTSGVNPVVVVVIVVVVVAVVAGVVVVLKKKKAAK